MPNVYPEVHAAISYGLSTVSNALNGISLKISQEMDKVLLDVYSINVDSISSAFTEENIGV